MILQADQLQLVCPFWVNHFGQIKNSKIFCKFTHSKNFILQSLCQRRLSWYFEVLFSSNLSYYWIERILKYWQIYIYPCFDSWRCELYSMGGSQIRAPPPFRIDNKTGGVIVTKRCHWPFINWNEKLNQISWSKYFSNAFCPSSRPVLKIPISNICRRVKPKRCR